MSQKFDRVALHFDKIAAEFPDFKMALILKHPTDAKEDIMFARDGWPLTDVITTISIRLGTPHKFTQVQADFCRCEDPPIKAQDGTAVCTFCNKPWYPA